MDLRATKTIVIELLQQNEKLRDDDDLLILEVFKKINPFISSYGFNYVMENRKRENMPSFESIRRIRQKLQAEFPELKGSERIQRERAIKEREYFELATE